jgi:hypothetical protein
MHRTISTLARGERDLLQPESARRLRPPHRRAEVLRLHRLAPRPERLAQLDEVGALQRGVDVAAAPIYPGFAASILSSSARTSAAEAMRAK